MVARLQLLDAEGREVSPDAALDLGSVVPGGTSKPLLLKVRNVGDRTVYFARVRAVPHPTLQTGQGGHTYGATEFALGERGDYARDAELGALAPGEECALWVRWKVPVGAPSGEVVWALEALGADA